MKQTHKLIQVWFRLSYGSRLAVQGLYSFLLGSLLMSSLLALVQGQPWGQIAMGELLVALEITFWLSFLFSRELLRLPHKTRMVFSGACSFWFGSLMTSTVLALVKGGPWAWVAGVEFLVAVGVALKLRWGQQGPQPAEASADLPAA